MLFIFTERFIYTPSDNLSEEPYTVRITMDLPEKDEFYRKKLPYSKYEQYRVTLLDGENEGMFKTDVNAAFIERQYISAKVSVADLFVPA